MASGFLTEGIDLDAIFLAYTSGAKAGVTGFLVAGVDFSDRLQAYAGGAKAAPTGYRVAGVDFCDLFAVEIPPSDGPVAPGFGNEYYASAVRQHDSAIVLTLAVRADGTWQVSRTGAGSLDGSPLSGTWHSAPAAGIGAGCQIRVDVDGVQGAWVSLGADFTHDIQAGASYPGKPTDSQTDALVVNIRRNNGSGLISEAVVLTADAEAF